MYIFTYQSHSSTGAIGRSSEPTKVGTPLFFSRERKHEVGVYIHGGESGMIWGQEIIYIMHCMKLSMLNEMYCTKFSKNKHEHCFFFK